jgi:1-acyl-sn-glycerol-3-phosphate acyltransferase
MEPVFKGLEITAKLLFRASKTKNTYQGLANIPARGGAVVALNHTGYIDFLPAAMATERVKRRIRFMIKAEMNDVRIVHFLISRSGTIPVNRQAGAEAYDVAVGRLREGELVGVYPEATISRSFELKDFKTGAARMALEAKVPIIPTVVWGVHRRWTKDHPKTLRRNKVALPVTVRFGIPLPPKGDVAELNTALRDVMQRMLYEVQEQYPHPAGEWWVPARLGGRAPTPAQAAILDQAELADRARRAAEQA